MRDGVRVKGRQCEDAGGCLYWVVIREVSDERWSPS